jgi:hypothetical protein
VLLNCYALRNTGVIQDPEKTYSGSWIQDSKKRFLESWIQLITVRIRIRNTGGQKISESEFRTIILVVVLRTGRTIISVVVQHTCTYTCTKEFIFLEHEDQAEHVQVQAEQPTAGQVAQAYQGKEQDLPATKEVTFQLF